MDMDMEVGVERLVLRFLSVSFSFPFPFSPSQAQDAAFSFFPVPHRGVCGRVSSDAETLWSVEMCAVRVVCDKLKVVF